jgi:hypothetical protein
MNSKNLAFLIIGIIVGSFGTYLTVKSNIGQSKTEKNEVNQKIESDDYSPKCSSYDIESSLNEYIEFYINNDDFYVLPNPQIKYQGNCEWHIKIVRQSRSFKDIQHTNFFRCTAIGDKLQWAPLN